MAEEPAIGITGVITIIIAIMIVVSGYFAAERKMAIDSRMIIRNDAASIYSALLEISSSEQGYVIYDRITKHYNISLDDSVLVVKVATPLGIVSYKLQHNLENIVPAKVNGTEAICIVKKIVDCRPQITICAWNNKTCCNIGETIC